MLKCCWCCFLSQFDSWNSKKVINWPGLKNICIRWPYFLPMILFLSSDWPRQKDILVINECISCKPWQTKPLVQDNNEREGQGLLFHFGSMVKATWVKDTWWPTFITMSMSVVSTSAKMRKFSTQDVEPAFGTFDLINTRWIWALGWKPCTRGGCDYELCR